MPHIESELFGLDAALGRIRKDIRLSHEYL